MQFKIGQKVYVTYFFGWIRRRNIRILWCGEKNALVAGCKGKIEFNRIFLDE